MPLQEASLLSGDIRLREDTQEMALHRENPRDVKETGLQVEAAGLHHGRDQAAPNFEENILDGMLARI